MKLFDAMVLNYTATVNLRLHNEVRVEAPRFYRWADTGAHEMICDNEKDAVDRMNRGFVECMDPKCSWCNSYDTPINPAKLKRNA